MELSKVESAQVELVATKAVDTAVLELSEMQLALIGGGIGETVL